MEERYIPLITKSYIRKIFLGDIVYIMKKQRKIQIVTEQEQFEYYEKMEPLLPYLDGRFYCCLRNIVINMDKVERMENQTIYFMNGERIWLGRDNYVRSKQMYSAYLKKLL